MTWEVDEMYHEGLGFFTQVVDAVPEGAWSDPAPCEGWRAIDVLGHVGEAASMGARILRGGDLTFSRSDPPGAAVDDDPASWWHALAEDADDAVANVADLDREVDSPMGKPTIRKGLSFPAVDLFIHGWDLGRATGVQVTIPDEAITFIRSMFDQIPDDVARRPGVFGPRVPEPDDATPTESLVAYCGRNPR